jgi:hypothetical protein
MTPIMRALLAFAVSFPSGPSPRKAETQSSALYF